MSDLYKEDRAAYWMQPWHRDVERPELAELMIILETVPVRVQSHQGAPTINTTLADVLKHPTAFCPHTLQFVSTEQVKE